MSANRNCADERDGDGCDGINRLLPDQPALRGLLAKIRDLGLCLISVRQLDPNEPGKTDQR